jgi:hypothetical protein
MPQTAFTRRTALRGLVIGAAAAAAPASVNSATAVAAGRRWLSGAGDDSSSNVAFGGFGTWRGVATTYARVWADASFPEMTNIWMMDSYRDAGWTGTLDIACGGPRDGQTWTSAAKGGMDATWRSVCRTVRSKWGTLSGVHLSMAHELNGDWFPWSVDSSEIASFKRAWARWYAIVQDELVAEGKNAKVNLSLNCDTVGGLSLLKLLPDIDQFDLVGVDLYSMWPDLTTPTVWRATQDLRMKDGAPRGIEAWFDFARKIGKPLSFPEWGLNPQSQSDNPFYIQQMHRTFAAHAPANPTKPKKGQLAGEAYFNTWDQCRLFPFTKNPRAAAMYQSLKFGR